MDAGEADRLARLEREMAILRSEFARLREHIGASPAEPSHAPPRPPPSTRPETPKASPPPPSQPFVERPARTGPSAEELIGRYGTIAVATITILVGVGIFLSWAIQRHLLGPEARIVLGYLAAIGVAAGGTRLRMRGTREFGNVLLAMALGIVHLVSWGAGPRLHVIPSLAALAIAFVASVVLAEFALRHDEEALCAIGFGGAAIAPFVTDDHSGNVIALAAYGVAVVALSAAALGDRPWRVARRVTVASFGLFLIGVAAGLPARPSWPAVAHRVGILFPMAVLVAILPVTHARHRRLLLRASGWGVVVGALIRGPQGPDDWSLILTVVASILTIGALDLTRPGALEREAPEAALDELVAKHNATHDGLLLPLGLFIAAIAAAPGPASAQCAEVAALWTGLAIYMTHRTRGEPECDMYATTASLIALWIVPAALPNQELARVVGMAAVGVGLMLVALRLARQPFMAGAIAALVVTSLWALRALEDRPPFDYLPFGTPATIVTVIALAGWLGALRIARRSEFVPTLENRSRSTVHNVLASGAAVTAFLWGRAEFERAWNPTASVALLTLYYASTGTLMIWLGRTRKVQPLRVIGLMLALLAAGKALVEAFQLPNVAVRLTVFFVVSAFLIAVGYWYRRGADEELATAPNPVG